MQNGENFASFLDLIVKIALRPAKFHFHFLAVWLYSLCFGRLSDRQIWRRCMEICHVSSISGCLRMTARAVWILTRSFSPSFFLYSFSEKAGVELDGGSYLIHKIYDDEETLSLVVAACETLGKLVPNSLFFSRTVPIFLSWNLSDIRSNIRVSLRCNFRVFAINRLEPKQHRWDNV